MWSCRLLAPPHALALILPLAVAVAQGSDLDFGVSSSPSQDGIQDLESDYDLRGFVRVKAPSEKAI